MQFGPTAAEHPTMSVSETREPGVLDALIAAFRAEAPPAPVAAVPPLAPVAAVPPPRETAPEPAAPEMAVDKASIYRELRQLA